MQGQDKPQQIPMGPQNGHVDLKGLNVPLPIKYLIQYGDSMGECASRSDALFGVLSALVDAGYDDDLIARLCLPETYGISELPREKGPEWLRQELLRVRRKTISLARCQRHGEMSRFRQDKMSHFLHVKRLQPGWLPRSSLAVLLLHRDTEHPRLALGLEPVALALDVDRCRVV